MNELEKIQEIVKNKIYNNKYSDDELDYFSNIVRFVMKAKENISNISLFDINVINFLIEKDVISNIDGKLLNSYRIALKMGKTLSDESANKLNDILKKISDKLREINNSLENTNVKLLFNKIKNGLHGLNSEELDLLFQLIQESDYSVFDKRDLIMYASLNIIKFTDEYTEDYQEIDETVKGITEEQCVELFAKYGYSFEDFSKPNQNAIKNKGNYEQIDRILNLLKTKGIDLKNNGGHNIFEDKPKNLVEILLKSNANCIERIISFEERYGIIHNNEIDFYKMVLTPSKFILRKRVYKSKYHTGHGGDGHTDICGSHQDFLENVEFFDQICNRLYNGQVNFFQKLYEKRNGSLLDYPHKKILEVERILKNYGLEEKDYFESATTVFVAMHQADVLDLAIELDMLDYLKSNQSTFSISMNDSSFDRLYVASKNKGAYMRNIEKKNFAGQKEPSVELRVTEINRTIDANPSIIPKRIIDTPQYDNMFRMFEEKVANEPFDLVHAINEINDQKGNSPLKILEEYFKVDDYLYEIAGIRISRLKVLRVYSALRNIQTRTPDAEKNKLLYAISKNSYMTKEDVEIIMAEYDKAKRQAREL